VSEPTFTGWVRKRTTSLRVKVVDRVAATFISISGVLTIVAVAGMCLFLVWVVVPLFLPGRIEPVRALPALLDTRAEAPVQVDIDEYESIGFAFFKSGEVAVFKVQTGEVLVRRPLFEGEAPISWSFAPRGGHAIFGFADGSVRYGTIGFESRFVEATAVERELLRLPIGESVVRDGDEVIQRTPGGGFRQQRFVAEIRDPVRISEHPIRLVDLSMQLSGPIFVALDAAGEFQVNAVRIIRNMMTRRETQTVSGGRLDLAEKADDFPSHLLFEGRGDSAMLIWPDGRLVRIDTRDRSEPVVAERIGVLPDSEVRAGTRISAVGFMIGKTTMLVGDTKGRLSTWFRIRPSDPQGDADRPEDGSILVEVHDLPGEEGTAVTSLTASSRNRMIAAGYANGAARVFYVTSDRLLGACPPQAGRGDPVTALCISPKNNGLLTMGSDGGFLWTMAIPHPQSTFSTIFRKVWYEGYERPEHVWQSSSGTDEFEPKFGLIPLIFGSIKATFYAMLFGAPLAILAAIYTSEFMHPHTRARIKPAIEVMASLPSVVLGFLAALVIAPIVEKVVPGILTTFIAVPFAVLLGAQLWQFLPAAKAARLTAIRIPAVFLFIAIGIAGGVSAGPLVEKWLFGGDIMGWLSWKPDPLDPAATAESPYRSAIGGWMILLLPAASILSWLAIGRLAGGEVRERIARMRRPEAAVAQCVKFAAGALLCVGGTYLVAALLSAMGIDSRGGFIDTYVQRNALIVGFIMGFAVIPIIYTIAEDALSSVPEHLRSGSLGLGATPWQTAVRIILPTAASGIFSALMIGLGRAVGETMIVLMAAGNTPVMQWNIFNGFRTLSANIAVELPEAARNSTDYRMLFLAALTLFVLTFCVNTLAEAVRQRFRKRAFAL
jgi:phosphate transport system permease protein